MSDDLNPARFATHRAELSTGATLAYLREGIGGVPLLLVLGHRTADGRHRLELAAAIAPDELRGRGAVERATRTMAAALEGFVRAHPAQWLWLHRRWKNVDASATARRRGEPRGTARPPRRSAEHP